MNHQDQILRVISKSSLGLYAMATAVDLAGLPMFSCGRSISRSPRYKGHSRLATHRAAVSNRKENRPVSNEGSALKKVGAFGISVKKTQLQFDSKNVSTNTPLDEPTDQEGAAYNNLPGVEISITKKIKKQVMLRHVQKHTDDLTSVDKLVLEDLRRGLQTRTHQGDLGGTRSILEAMSDPKIKESRMIYEPLSKFLSNNERQEATRAKKLVLSKPGANIATFQGFPNDLRLFNVSVPPTRRHFNTPVEQPQVTGSTPSRKISQNSTKHGYPLFPKMSTSLFNANTEKRGNDKTGRTQSNDTRNQVQYSLTPSVAKNHDENISRLEVISLPSISLHAQDNEATIEEQLANHVNAQPTTEEDAATQRAKPKLDKESGSRTYRNSRPRPTRYQNNTANLPHGGKYQPKPTGKSRLIGPMNKMDMIAEYSKMLQNRTINYDQYIKKISKLSLHKIDLENSGMRHYHIVRDSTTGMKHRLEMVNIYPSHAGQRLEKEHSPLRQMGRHHEQNYPTGRNTDTAMTKRQKSILHRQRASTTEASRENLPPSAAGAAQYSSLSYKISRPQVSRISIGEGIPESRFEHFASGYDFVHDDFLSYDDVIRMQGSIDRYQDAHRPTHSERRFYNWTHIPPSSRSGAQKMDSHDSDLYKGYSGKPLPNSREIKERLNFSYPSYDPSLAHPVATMNQENAALNIPAPIDEGEKEIEDPTHDPDYLAITLDQAVDKSPSTERQNVASSLSIHEVTLPTEMSMVAGRIAQQRANAGSQKKGLVLGTKEPSTKQKESDNKELRSSIESLNITPVAITTSPAVNLYRSQTRPIYYVSQDDFAATGTDGVLQNHLSTIYKSISRAKSRGESKGRLKDKSNGKFSPREKVAHKKFNNHVPKVQEEPEPLSEENLRIAEKVNETAKNISSHENGSAEAHQIRGGDDESTVQSAQSALQPAVSVSPVMPNPPLPIDGSPAPPSTAMLLNQREDEATSVESEDGGHEFPDVISVNVTEIGVKSSA